MKKSHKKFLAGVFILLTSILLLSSNVLAAYPYLPYLDYVANFSYNDGVGGSNANKYKLTFNTWNITGGNYASGSYFGEGSDLITGAVITIGNLYNDTYNQNLIFGNTNNGGTGANGVTGPVSFTISDGTTTYLSALLNNFIITDGSFGTQLNPLWDHTTANLTNITFTANGSQYIQELQASYQTNGYLNLGMDFTFTSGTSGGGYAFSNDASGSIQGKMAVTPEPLSSILFITGGATLAVRRYFKKKGKNK
ncbi:MAG: hypothetical protein Q8N09_06805 [Thermodesulfovibrionia bacterium]|nr:hypothetical protein [Thermodesulfovibrionia bacterium]